jgi:hypothetical protein
VEVVFAPRRESPPPIPPYTSPIPPYSPPIPPYSPPIPPYTSLYTTLPPRPRCCWGKLYAPSRLEGHLELGVEVGVEWDKQIADVAFQGFAFPRVRSKE